MGTKRRVEKQVVVLKLRHPTIDADIVQERAWRHGALVPIRFVVPPPLGGQQRLLDVVVIPCGHHRRCGNASAIGQHHAAGASPVVEDGRHLRGGLENHPLPLRHAHHGLYDLVHSAHGIPGSQTCVRVVHQRVQGRGVLGFGPKEQHRELHDLEKLGVLEMLSGKRTEGSEQRQACGVDHGLPFRELQRIVRGLVHEFVHANVVLDLGLRHEFAEFPAGSDLDFFEDGRQRIEPGRDLKRTVLEPDGVGGVEANEVHFLVHVGSKILEVTFKHVRHPVPARAHVKREPVHFKLPRPPAQRVVAFNDAYAVSSFGQVTRRGEASKAGSEDQNLVGGRSGCCVHEDAIGCIEQPLARVRCSTIAVSR